VERSRLLGRRFGLHVGGDDRTSFYAFLERAFSSPSRESCELTLLRGGRDPVAVRIDAAVPGTGRECRIVLVDLSGQKQAEEDRLILNKLESTGILAGGLAHDFNNLLTVILLDIERVQDLSRPADGSILPLADAKMAVLSARTLTEHLITFAKGGAPMRKPTRLDGLIRESIRLPLSGSRVRCEVFVAADLWSADVDEGQIGQVIRNLVINAREAMPDGGVISLRAENVVLGSEDSAPMLPGEYVRISVADRGCGMTKDVLAKIFDPYFSTKQRGSEKGMGLGLTICHSIVQKHGGLIRVTSEIGVGSTFHVYLPACLTAPSEKKAPTSAGTAPPARILVMDDDETVRRLFGRLLRRMGHEVELVSDGDRAIEVCRQAMGDKRPFDAVFLDLTVRAGAGAEEAMRSLRGVDPSVKAIVMSGHAADPVMLHPELHGFAGVLIKPFDTERLGEILSRVLGSVPDPNTSS
jgi:signal transduction histidine kinase/ActR/RegA family two-component response regulator